MKAAYPIPDEALAQHAAFLGKTGSGKTSSAKTAVEHLVAQGARVCVLDPIKSDWWGMTSSADGQKPGLPFQILGGPHGHVPLHESAGHAIGEIVAGGQLPLSIIDMRLFGMGGQAKFFTEFAPALMNNMSGVVHLVMEEAHLFAPKERSGSGGENMSIHWATRLATAGRSTGIRLILVTQRVQALHNALLGSCETMVAHRLTTPADQKPVVDWLKANAQRDVMQQVSAELASLPTGTAWVCSGEARLFERVQFPRIGTYDNSATPTGSSIAQKVRMATVDVEKLRAIVGSAVQEAELNDPAHLKAEVGRLRRELSAAGSPTAGAKSKAYNDGFADGGRIAQERFAREHAEFEAKTWAVLQTEMQQRIRGATDRVFADFRKERAANGAIAAAAAPVPKPAPMRPKEATALPEDPDGYDKALTRPQLTVLGALRFWDALGVPSPEREKVAVVCGWSTTSSNIRDRLSELIRIDAVSYPKPGLVALTSLGLKLAPAPGIPPKLIDALRGILTRPQNLVLDALVKADQSVTRDFLAEAVGWSTTSSNIRDRLSELVRLGIVEYPTPGSVQLTAWARDMAVR